MKRRSFFKTIGAFVAVKEIAVNISAPVVRKLTGKLTKEGFYDLIYTSDDCLRRQAELIMKDIDKELIK